MMDFTNCEINKFKYYGGINGGKICIIYNNTDYMLKFPSVNEVISKHGYSNSCISEIRKEFYKKILHLRYEKILKFSYEKLIH